MSTTREQQRKWIDMALAGDVVAFRQGVIDAGGDWARFGIKLADWLEDIDQLPPFKVFGLTGNVKLPFMTFSTLPDYTCPGAGSCLYADDANNGKKELCYSFKAWRFPAAFFRQIQNTILIRRRKRVIEKIWMSLPTNRSVRLYVDGDIDSQATLRFWMRVLSRRPDLAVYGYSKSWALFLDYEGAWPTNYLLNISSGSIYGDDVRARMLALPVVRGSFDMVPIDKKLAGKYSDPEYKAAMRSQAKGFLCPGRCGTCTKTVHACGSKRFDGVPILIGIH